NIFTQKQLKEAKSLLGKVSWLMSLLGIWPVEKTRFQRIKFKVYVAYVTLHLAMTVNNLVANFSNVKLVTIIIQQLMGIGMTFNRLLFINYSSNVSEIIKTTKEEIAYAALTDITEKKIFIKLHKAASLYYHITIKFMVFTSLYYYSLPLIKNLDLKEYSKASNVMVQKIIKVFFFNSSSLKRTFFLHIYELPALFMQPNFCASVNMQVIIVMNLAAQMAILGQRIKNLDLKEYSKASNVMVQKIVIRHMELTKLAKKIENTWTPIYCIELGFYMPLTSLVIYNAMNMFNNNQKLLAVPYYIYIIVTLSSLFGHCLMGELVKTQSENLLDAYYNSNWCEMPIKYKKSILICMTYTKIALNITAGKFFVYSLSAFTGILKSIMAYVSLLREVM
ncbi:GSCOCT00005679001.2-RA-CDS, partial [Cotesia congregata]